MRLPAGLTFDDNEKRLRSWHRWFAWYPVKIASYDRRWLEWVERKGEDVLLFGGPDLKWHYRATTHHEPRGTA